MQKILRKLRKVFLRHRHYLLIIFLLLIFILSVWDHNFYIGGDVMVPLNPANNIQKIFLWDNGLESFQYVGFFWLAFYYLFSLIGLPVFVTQKILLVLLLIIGFVFTYLLYKEFFKDTKYDDKKLAFLSATIFTFNPIYFLLVNAYLPLYGFPVCFYFLIKFLQKGKMLYAILFSLLLNFFFFTDLPQPKLLIVFSVACLFLIIAYRQTRKLIFKDLFRRVIIIFLFGFLLNAWVFIPLLYSLFRGAAASFVKDVGTHGGLADFKTAALPYIMRFFNYHIVKYYPRLEHFLVSPIFVIWTFTQWVILTLGVFLAKKDKKNSKIIYTLMLSTLFFIFIAKGANPPLGQFYRALVIYFPLAKIFRTTSSVTTGAVVFYALSLSISAYYLSKKKKAIVYFIIIFNIAIFYPLYFGYKFYNQLDYTPDQKGYPIPDQYYEMGKRLDNIEEDSKVLSIPLIRGYVEKDWPYSGPDILSWITIKPLNPLIYREGFLGLSKASDKDMQTVPKSCGIYALNNIKYFLFQKDSIDAGDSYENLNPGDLLIRNNYFDLYEIKNECFLPHFYAPQNIIYANGGIEDLEDVVSFGDYEIRSGIYLENLKPESSGILEQADEIFVKAELENKISEEELNRVTFDVESVFFPYVRWKPGSFVYPLVLKKEQFDEWRVRDDPEQLFEKKLFYAAKRISEIEKWGLTLDENNWEKTVDRYEQKMKEAFEVLEKIKQEEKRSFFSLLAKLEVSLQAHQGRLENLRLSEEREVQFENIFEKLEEKLNQIKIKHDFSRLVYKFDIPKEGEYEVFIKKVEIEKLENWEIEVDGEKIDTGKVEIREDGWMNLGKKNFKEGEHELILHLPEPENLTGKNWQQFSDLETGDEVLFFSPQSIFPGSTSVGFQEIRDYTPNTIFRLTFDYKAQSGRAGFSVIQDTDKDEETEEIRPLFTKVLRKTKDGKFEQAEILIKSNPQASLARLYLFAQPEEGKVADVKFKNFKVEKSREPAVLVRTKIDSTEEGRIMPKITFMRVNPTKYRVKVEGAKKPYTLVFSESFHKGWKAHVSDQQSANSSQQYGDIVASYFDGEIKEGTHKNIFLDRNTFETWGKKPIPEDRHLLINGYANSWYITPQDSDGVDTYEIIVEFQPQRWFYLGLGISTLTLVGCLGYLGYSFGRKKLVAGNEKN